MHDDPFARAVERVQAAEQNERDAKRQKREEMLKSGSRTGFRIHATVFVAVNVLLIAIWALVWQLNDGTSYPWFVFVLLGWGIGLAAHYAAVRNHVHRRTTAPAQTQPAQAQPAQSQPAQAQPAEPVASAAPTTADELSRLADLRRSGALTEDEYKAAKAKHLSSS